MLLIFRVPTDRGWMPDSGPDPFENSDGDVAYIHFSFNGWAKYLNHKKDAIVVVEKGEPPTETPALATDS